MQTDVTAIPKRRFRFWPAIIVAGLVHYVFILEFFIVLPEPGLFLRLSFYFFFPHMLLMYFLPPGYDGMPERSDWWFVIGKIIDVAPASLLYGFIVQWLIGRCRKIWRLRRGT